MVWRGGRAPDGGYAETGIGFGGHRKRKHKPVETNCGAAHILFIKERSIPSVRNEAVRIALLPWEQLRDSWGWRVVVFKAAPTRDIIDSRD